MTITLELPQDLERELAAEAARQGLSLPEYALQLLSGNRTAFPAFPASDMPRTGAELVSYWERSGVVGSRPDIHDSAAHARVLREQAQRRTGT